MLRLFLSIFPLANAARPHTIPQRIAFRKEGSNQTINPNRKIYAVGDLHGDDSSFILIMEGSGLAKFTNLEPNGLEGMQF